MELGGGGRRGDGVRRQVQSVGRLAAYLAGGFLLLSAASSVAVRSLRALSDANQRKFATPCGACEGKGTYACRLCRGSAAIEWSPMRDPVFINPCVCPTCDGTRVQRCLNCLGKGREIAAPTQNEGSIGECAICRLCFMWEGISHMCQKYILSFEA